MALGLIMNYRRRRMQNLVNLDLSTAIKIKGGYLTPAVLGAQKKAKWLPNHYCLRGPQRARASNS